MKIKQISKSLVKNTFLTILDDVRANLPPEPYLRGSLFACRVAVASFFDLYPTEGQEFWELLKEYTPKINEKLLSSEEFQQSLAITFETLLRTREKKKRDLIKQIYLDGYISVEDRQNMNLERFYRVAHEISLEALEYLKFIVDEIIPRKEKWAREEVAKMNKENREKDDEWWFKRKMEEKPESEIITHWIYEEYNPNSETVKNRMPDIKNNRSLMDRQWEEERKKYKQYSEIASEFVSLGIFRTIVKDGGIGSGASKAESFTEFGLRFIDFVRNLSLEKD